MPMHCECTYKGWISYVLYEDTRFRSCAQCGREWLNCLGEPIGKGPVGALILRRVDTDKYKTLCDSACARRYCNEFDEIYAYSLHKRLNCSGPYKTRDAWANLFCMHQDIGVSAALKLGRIFLFEEIDVSDVKIIDEDILESMNVPKKYRSKILDLFAGRTIKNKN